MQDTLKLGIPLTPRDFKIAFGGNKKFRQPLDPVTGKKITLRPNRDRTGVILETSVARLLQGHNVCGTNKMQRLCYQAARRVHKLLDLEKTASKVKMLKDHDYDIFRADVTGWFNAGSQANVVSVMAELDLQLTAQGVDLVVHKNRNGIGTIYIGKHSRHATLKFYNKYLELKHSGLPDWLSDKEKKAILEAAKPLVRVELTLRLPALNTRKVESLTEDLTLRKSSDWSVKIARQLLDKAMARYTFHGHIRAQLDPEEIEGMTELEKMYYSLHQRGINLAQVMEKRSFKKWRTRLLRLYRIDIGRPVSDTPAPDLSLAELLAPSKLMMNWPTKLRKLGLVAGTDEWKQRKLRS